MKIKLTKDDEKSAILKAIASKDKATSENARVALAALVGPVVSTVLDQAATSNLVYKTLTYDMDSVPEIPIDLYFDNNEGLMTVWSQSTPGGLATNEVIGGDNYRFKTYNLDSAISFSKRYVKNGRMDVVEKGIARLVQEVLVKQEYQAWSVLLKAVGDATTNGSSHIISATTAGQFQLDDVNRLWTKVKRLRNSWVGGTPTSNVGKGLTDLFLSPEMTEDVRSWAYNPVNTTAVPNTDESTVLALPDSMRESIFNGAGVMSIFGVKLNELREFGTGRAYNAIFDAGYAGSFDPATQQLVLGADLSVDSAIRVLESDPESNSTFALSDDDQWVTRSEKMGWYGSLTEGRMIGDVKAFVGLIV